MLRRGQAGYERFERAMQLPLLALSLVFVAAIALPGLTELDPAVRTACTVVSIAVWVAFVAEYLVLLYLAPDRRRMVRTHLLDLAIVAFPLLRPLAAAQAVRLLHVGTAAGRAADSFRRDDRRPGVGRFLAAMAVVVVLGGIVAFSFERDVESSRIRSAGDGIWWAVETVTTVGYGDLYPVSLAGRIVATVLMLLGVALLSVVTANIAARYVERDEGSEVAELRDRLARLEAVLVADELRKLVDLRDAGALDDESFAQARRRLLERS